MLTVRLRGLLVLEGGGGVLVVDKINRIHEKIKIKGIKKLEKFL